MKQKTLSVLLSVVVVATMLLTACAQTAATPTAVTVVTEAPTVAPAATDTTAPTTAPEATATTAATTAPEATATTAAPAYQGMKVEAPDCSYKGEFKSIEAVDESTVKFTLCYPDAAFKAKIAFAAFPIVDKDYLDSMGGDSVKISENPVGSGPYMVKEWVRGDHITFVPNPNYWGTAPANKTFILKWAKETAQRLLEAQSGNADGYSLPSPDDLATIQADANLKLYPLPPTNTMYFGMNNTKPPFDKEEVRQAFAMAIDRERIVKNFYPEGSLVPTQFVPPTVKPGYTEGAEWYKYDPAKAKEMLTAAGFDFSQEILFSYRDVSRGYVPQPGKVAQDVQAQLAEIGVKIKLDVQESGTLLANSKEGKLTFFLLGWGEDYPDATDWYDYHFSENHLDFGKAYPDIVAAFTKGATTSDAAARQAAYDEVNKLLLQHVPVIPVAHAVNFNVYRANVKNVVLGPYNSNFQEMGTDSGQLVYVQNAEPITLWCADEEDGETFNACDQIYDKLLRYKFGTSEVEPALAEKVDANADLTEYTVTLRKGVKFSNGATLDANDVVASFAAQWDYKNPNHKGNTGVFQYFSSLFGAILNKPPAQ